MKHLTRRAWAIAALATFGVGVVASASAATIVNAPVAVTVLSADDIDSSSLTSILETLQQLPDVQTYRFAGDTTGAPTLDRDVNPAATPDLLGLAILSPGDAGYEGLEDALRSSSIRFITSGMGLDGASDYAMFMASREVSTAPLGDPYAYNVQIDWPLSFTGQAGWQADPAFPGDTWQGASLVLSTRLWVDQDPTVSLIDVSSDFQEVPTNAVVALADDWMITLIDLESLASKGELSGWAFASHIHDGTYGVCDTCESIITSYPGVPRTATELNAWPTATITLALPAPDAETSAPTDGTTDPGSTAVVEGGSGTDLTALWWILVLLLVASGAVWFLCRRHRRDTSTTDFTETIERPRF